MAFLLSLSLPHPNPPQNPNPNPNPNPISPQLAIGGPSESTSLNSSSKRHFILKTTSLCLISSIPECAVTQSSVDAKPPLKPGLPGIANTKSWFQFYGDGFSIRVPPQFEDVMEPEDYSAGLSLYGDKAKTKTFAARFASPDGSEVLSVVTRPTNQLKITFLEAKDISDIGSLKDAAKTFVPGGATLFSARTFKIKEDEGFRHLLLEQLHHCLNGMTTV